jgi:hypothetical protein
MRNYVVLIKSNPETQAIFGHPENHWNLMNTRGGPVRFSSLASAWWYVRMLRSKEAYGTEYKVGVLELRLPSGEELNASIFHEDNDQHSHPWHGQLAPTFSPEYEAKLIEEYMRTEVGDRVPTSCSILGAK